MPRPIREKKEWYLDPVNQERYGFTAIPHPQNPGNYLKITFDDGTDGYVANNGLDYYYLVEQKLYERGYTRTLTDEDKVQYLSGRSWDEECVNWLEKEWKDFSGTPRQFIAKIKAQFGASRSIVFQDDKPIVRKYYTKYFVWTDEEGLKEKYIKDEFYDQFLYQNKRVFVISSNLYNLNGRNYYLGDIILNDFVECEDHPGTWYRANQECPICAVQYRIQSYSTNALNTFGFKKKETEKNPVYMGIELEFDTAKSRAVPLLKKYKHHMIAKEDGSITGFEMVTAPATFSIHTEEFRDFPFNEQIVTHRDGMHVHVDKKALSTMQMGKIFEFIYNDDNYTLIKKIAGRDLGTYCSTTTKKSVLSNIEEYERGITYRVEGSHHTAINVSNKDTIEFRIFKTPKTYEEFMARLEFVKAMVDWTKPGQVPYGIKGFREEKNFLNYVTECRKVYPNLFKEII